MTSLFVKAGIGISEKVVVANSPVVHTIAFGKSFNA